jgi:hypothetical protein
MLGRSDQGGAAARLLDLGLVAALQQRLRVFGRAPLPRLIQLCATNPSAVPVTLSSQPDLVEVEVFCTAITKTIGAIGWVVSVCNKSAGQRSATLQAIRQLLSDRFSLVAVVEKGLAPAVLWGAAAPPPVAPSADTAALRSGALAAAERCAGHVRTVLLLVADILSPREALDCGHNKALVRRLQQQLTTFLNLDAIRPHLEALCLPPPGCTCLPSPLVLPSRSQGARPLPVT